MPIEFSIITAAGGALIGIAGTGAYFFSKGYAQRAGANAADKTPYIKSETINKSNKEGNLRIVEKMETLREEKQQLREAKMEQEEIYQSELSDYERILESIKDESVARKRLIENYWKPLHAIVACFTKSKVEIEVEDGEEASEETNFVLEALRDGREVEQISGSTWIVPPKDVPERIKANPNSREALKEWIQDEVYSDYPDALAHIGLFGLVDLRNVYSSSDYEPDDLPHFFSTIDWEFDLEEIFDSQDFSRLLANESVNLTEIIENGDIAFLVSNSVSTEELDDIHNAQEEIERELGNPNVKEFASQVDIQTIAGALSPYVADSERVAEGVKNEAEIWTNQLY
ncbi:hypothetical protein Halar_0054 (plasmid) [halophilic archaeon DL31]|jgi:hypothetical protein|nr:hypothetical protein Halar_0054 [halophilic archaeon DL31]